jgi:hypothetical protein
MAIRLRPHDVAHRDSKTTGLPMAPRKIGDIGRATMSEEPPGWKGTTMVMGQEGRQVSSARAGKWMKGAGPPWRGW